MPPYYFFIILFYVTVHYRSGCIFIPNRFSHTLRQILYRALYILHPLARQFHPRLALFLHAASVFIACLFICKTQSMSANRIKMHLYRYFQFTQCVKKTTENSLQEHSHPSLYATGMLAVYLWIPGIPGTVLFVYPDHYNPLQADIQKILYAQIHRK